MTKLSPWMIAILLVCLTAFCTFAAAQTASTPESVTGCLQKGVEPNGGFYLITSTDKHLELYDNGQSSLGNYVGQTVTLTGTTPHRSAAQEKVSQPYEKQETGAREHGDFQVTSVKVVSASCAK